MDMVVIINQMIPLFLMLAIGYVLCKIDIFDETLNKKLTKFLLNVTTPAIIISSVLTNRISTDGGVVAMFFITAGVYMILPIISFVLVKVMRIPLKQQGLYMFMTIFSNAGFMGFPVVEAIFGSEAIFYAAILNMGFNLLIYTVGIIIMNYGSENEVKMNFKSVLTPGVIASLAAIFIYVGHFTFPTVLVNTCSMLGNLTTPLAMLLIGSTLANMPIKEVFNDIRVYGYTMVRQVVIPIIAFPVLQFFIKDSYLLGITFIIVAMPVANSAVLFATEYGGDVKLAAKSVFLTTLVSVVTIPLLVYMYLI